VNELLAGCHLVVEFDDLLLLRREGEVVLERPERTGCSDIAALGAEGERDRQGLE